MKTAGSEKRLEKPTRMLTASLVTICPMESTDSGRITRNPETPPNFFGSEASQKGKFREWSFHVPPCAIVRECGSVEGAELGEFTISLMPPAVFSDLEGDLHGALFFPLYVDSDPSLAKPRMPQFFPGANTRV